MKLNSSMVARPVMFFIFLAIVVSLIPAVLIPFWYKTNQQIEKVVRESTKNLQSGLQSQIQNIAHSLHPLNSSAINLARILTSSLSKTNQLSFSDIQIKVAPSLFQAFSTIPLITQVSYMGSEGHFFAYYIDNNQTLALYSNSSSSSSSFKSNGPDQADDSQWYTQPVDRETGEVYGEAIGSTPLRLNSSWFRESIKSTNGFSYIGNGYNKERNLIFLNSASVNGNGVVSLGFPVESITGFFSGMDLHGGILSIVTTEGKSLVKGLSSTRIVLAGDSIFFRPLKSNGNEMSHVGLASCLPNNNEKFDVLSFREIDYKVYCSPIDIMGVKSVYALALPSKGLARLVHKSSKLALILLILTIVSILVSVFSFVFIMIRAAKREMHLCASLIKHMEATQQAERKSMNKSTAFASASHDIRASLAGITGLIEISYGEVTHGSELEINLRQMQKCADDLLSLLNSILDTSKIEAGKMRLEEEEFEMAVLLEDVVDLYHPVGMKKGIDVILDSHDGSILRFSHVKGDKGKLKQILCNLLSNAVKFTSEGYVSVRAWAQKPRVIENSIIENHRKSWLQNLSCLFGSKLREKNDLEAVNSVQTNPNSMEFVFEVNDTGKGIPKDKQQSVFENYVQVKDGQGGTGLGLGIVQSLVRLMGGDIAIIDKENEERGTCFRFNIFLTICDPSTDHMRGETEFGDDFNFNSRNQHTRMPASSPRLTMLNSSFKGKHSRVVLLISNEERCRASQKYMQNLGINVSVVKKWEHLRSTLKKMKSKLSHSRSEGKLELSSWSDDISSESSKDVPLSSMQGRDEYRPGIHRRSFILLVIDATAGPFPEIFRTVSEFRRNLNGFCKVVWLDKPTSRSINVEETILEPTDWVLLKPFHGSRLYKVIRLLPEFGGGSSEGLSVRTKRGNKHSSRRTKSGKYTPRQHLIGQAETEEDESSEHDIYKKDRDSSNSSFRFPTPNTSSEIKEEYDDKTHDSDDKPLVGKRFLVAEDAPILRKLAMSNLHQLGATTEPCENGEQAVKLVHDALKAQQERGDYSTLPYDYILMDCEMPVMNGFKASETIREVEKPYGIHTPIIALTAHSIDEATDKIFAAGMDFYLGKPLTKDTLLEALRSIHSKNKHVP